MPLAETKTYFGDPDCVTAGVLTPSEAVDCPLCGKVPQRFAVDYQGFQLCRCRGCGLEMQNPRLTFDQLAETVYTEGYCPGHEETATPTASLRQLANFERLLNRKGDLLDVGCGNGSFLRFAGKRGWRTFGTDIKLSPETAGLDRPLWEGRLTAIDFGEARFDVIRFNHVLEHLQNPLDELVYCQKFLKRGGIIFVGVPNIGGISTRIKNIQSRLGLKRRRWRHYAAMHHLYYFTFKTLQTMIERAGYSVVLWETPVDKEYSRIGRLYGSLAARLHAGSLLDMYITPR